MLSHIAKLIWNRKRSNSLIISEVALTFMVLFTITSLSLHNYQKFYQPLGFDWKNTWSVRIDSGEHWNQAVDTLKLKNLVDNLKQQAAIKSVGLSSVPVFRNASWGRRDDINGKNIRYEVNYVNQDGPKDWGVELVAGRWFGEEDNGQNYIPVMVSQRFIDAGFKDKNLNQEPINFEFSNPESEAPETKRIVGVFKEFRQKGEFGEITPYLFHRYDINQGSEHGVRYIHLKFNKQESAAYEETLLKTLKAITPDWEFEIKTWESMRTAQIDSVLIPMIIMLVVVGFLLLMVAMGLFGVLWQNINRRTQEIGLRRAIGASKKSIQLQIISELLVVALFGMIISFLVLVQLPMLQLIEAVSWGNFWLSIIGSVSVMVLMVILCALYPSRNAIKLAPALALHYE